MDIAGGVADYRTVTSSFTGGVLLNFWMPRANEKLYLRTGLLYSKYEDVEDAEDQKHTKISICKIPLMVEYIYPKLMIRPKVAYGIGLHLGGINFFSVTAMGGFNIQLSKSLSLTMEYSADFEQGALNILPGTFVYHSFLGGIQFKF